MSSCSAALAHLLTHRASSDAGGCFWGTELAFQRVPGVVKTAVGYTQGQTKGPSYDAVCGGRTGHTEGVLVGLFLFKTVQMKQINPLG